ncbi:hypothetical protein [Paenibacillus durus]|uniref:Lipoprotein n=1 Tax=Paenibacillus durus ATCC 35681 TaxID=1333534 RepID=A0A0F7CJR1_PAEDU|nr:hypothetical protein [Paenibacillus durus]AKG36401.1 hypothetical protein VK70_19155 [Paenibacillus durus ATCC 35681]
MKLLKCVSILIILLISSGCGNGTTSASKQSPNGTAALNAIESAAPAAIPSAAPTAIPSASPAAIGTADPRVVAPSAVPTLAPPAAGESAEFWAKLDKELESEDYRSIAAEFEKVPNPSEDLTAMYNFAMYNIYGQDGDDEKSLEYLYKIPADYQGRHADLVSYWKFVHESYAEGKTENITFDEYKQKYYKSGKSTF